MVPNLRDSSIVILSDERRPFPFSPKSKSKVTIQHFDVFSKLASPKLDSQIYFIYIIKNNLRKNIRRFFGFFFVENWVNHVRNFFIWTHQTNHDFNPAVRLVTIIAKGDLLVSQLEGFVLIFVYFWNISSENYFLSGSENFKFIFFS